MSMNSEREVLGWLEFGDASRDLAHEVLASGFEPEVVVAMTGDHSFIYVWNIIF